MIVFNILNRRPHPEAKSVFMQIDFFFTLTFNNHHVIAIKCIATTNLLFPVNGVIKLGEAIY